MKKYSILLLILLAVFGCDRDDGNFNPFSKAQLFTSAIGQLDETTIALEIPIAVNDFSSISDVSQGINSRRWTIDTGMAILKPTFKPEDSLNLSAFISGSGRSSSESKIFFLFQEPGLKEVKVKQLFDKQVNYLGQTAVQEGANWALETTFKYEVFEDINAEARISNEDGSQQLGVLTAAQNPDSSDTSGFQTITIEAGSILTFTDLTTIGNPDSRIWNFNGGSPEDSTEENVQVSYNRLGEFLVDLTATRDARGLTLRAAEQTKTLPYIIKVIPSTQPYVISGNGNAVDDGEAIGTNIIQFRVNGELADVSGSEADFTVNAVNGIFNSDITVNTVAINTTDATLVVLTLSELIYNTDTVTISYAGTTITSVDMRTLNTFTSVPVDPFFRNVLQPASNPSFENAVNNDRNVNTLGYNLFVGGGGNDLANATNSDGTLQLNRSTERSSNGDASLKFDADMPLVAGFLSLSNTLIPNSAIAAGDHKLTFDIYMEPGSQFNGIFNRVIGGDPVNETILFNTPVTGEWFTVERSFTNDATLNGNIIFNFRNNDNVGITGRQTFFIDNLKVLVVENRP